MNIDNLITGADKKDSKKKISNNAQPKKKKYKRLYLHTETIDLLYDIIYTKKTSGDFDYTIGDAIKDGLEAISKGKKLKKAPASFIESKGTK